MRKPNYDDHGGRGSRHESRRFGTRRGFSAFSMLAMLMSLLPSLASAAPLGGTSSALSSQGAMASITVNVRECAATTDTSDEAQSRTNDDLAASCTKPLANITANLTNIDTNEVTTITSASDGTIAFAGLAPGSYSAYTDIPRGTAWEVVYCSADGGAPYQKTFDESVVTTFADLQNEQIVCTWYVIPVETDASTPTPVSSPTVAAPTSEISTPEQTSTEAENAPAGVITVDAFSCPSDAGLNGQSSFSDLDAACTTSVPDITLHFSNQADGVDDPRGTGNGGMVSWENLAPASYDLYSDIPREFATEVLYCSNLAGDISAVPFNDNIVATLNLAAGERFDCSWFVIPEDLKGETPTPTATTAAVESPTAAPTDTVVDGAAAGTSLTVHLAVCPVDYQGGDYFNDCHANGVDGMEFLLDGPDGELSQTTTLPTTPGPGVATFSDLSGGDYTLAGGPPGDFGSVVLYCSTQPDGTRIPTSVESTQATFSIDPDTNVLCDWYYIPEDARGETPTPTQTATSVPTTAPTATATPTQAPKAEVLVTLYQCPAPAAGETYGGATYDQLASACTQTVDDVPFTLRDADAAPLTANTGVSGAGAVRFYDLLPADYTLSPSLPVSLTSTAVFCTINGENRYQKALQNGSVTFVDVESEQLACSWFAVSAPQPTPTAPAPTTEPSQPTATAAPTQVAGPTGSITVREYLCEKDKASIKDWERECTPGSSGQTFRLANAQLGVDTTGITQASTGVLTFARLQNGHYELTEETGAWCRATADRVDSESRVIVADGANTDVVIYQCNATKSLPSTGSGTQISSTDRNAVVMFAILAMVVVSAALALVSIATFVRTERARRHAPETRESANKPVPTESGRMRMRFR